MSEQLDLDALEALATAATPGPWTEFDDDGEAYSRPPATGAFLVEYGADAEQKMRDIRYIAAADPPTVLALIAALSRAEETIERFRQETQEIPGVATPNKNWARYILDDYDYDYDYDKQKGQADD